MHKTLLIVLGKEVRENASLRLEPMEVGAPLSPQQSQRHNSLADKKRQTSKTEMSRFSYDINVKELN